MWASLVLNFLTVMAIGHSSEVAPKHTFSLLEKYPSVARSHPAKQTLLAVEEMLNRHASKSSTSSEKWNVHQLLTKVGVFSQLPDSDTTHLTGVDKSELENVTKIMQTFLVGNLDKLKKEDQDEVDADFEAFTQCDTDKDSAVAVTASTFGANVNSTRSAHIACRQEESKANTENSTKWKAFEKLETELPKPPSASVSLLQTGSSNPPPACPTFPSTLDDMDAFFDDKNPFVEWLLDPDTGAAPIFTAKREAAEESSVKALSRRVSCEKNQSSFEQAFCAHARDLAGVCSIYDTCHSTRSEKYKTTRSRVQMAETQRKGFYKSSKAIICHLSVILEANDKSHSECADLSVDTSAYDMNYPSETAKTSCDMSSIEHEPCDAKWIEDEYGSLPDNVQHAPCSSCPASITTAAPSIMD